MKRTKIERLPRRVRKGRLTRCSICRLENDMVESIEKDFKAGMSRLLISQIYKLSYWALCTHLKFHMTPDLVNERELVEEGTGVKQSEASGSSVETQENSSISKHEPEPEPEQPDMSFQPLPTWDGKIDPKLQRRRRDFARWAEQSMQGDHDRYTSHIEPSMI